MAPACILTASVVGWAGFASPAATAAPLDRRTGPGETAVELGGAWSAQAVPAFRRDARDRLAAGLVGDWTPAPQVSLHLAAGWAREAPAAGDPVAGLDALSVLARAHLLRQPERPLHLALGFLAAVPLAPAEVDLGSGESDVDLLLEAGRDLGSARLDLVLGLAIRGSPLHPAEQDDAALSRLHLSLPAGPLDLHARAGGTFAAPVEPPRLDTVAGLSLPLSACGPVVGVEGGVGLTDAAADGQIALWVRQDLGGPGPCRRGDGD